MNKQIRTALATLSAVLVAGAIAWAANTTFFTNIGDVVFPFSPPNAANGTPGAIDNMTIGQTTPQNGTFKTAKATQLLGAWGTYAINPASVASYASYAFANGQTLMSFTPSGTVSYIYVTMAPSPNDGDQACLFSTQTVTNLYLTASPGQTLVSAATTLTANARQCYTYSAGALTWTRTQ